MSSALWGRRAASVVADVSVMLPDDPFAHIALAEVLAGGRTPVLYTSRGEARCRHAGERRALGLALTFWGDEGVPRELGLALTFWGSPPVSRVVPWGVRQPLL